MKFEFFIFWDFFFFFTPEKYIYCRDQFRENFSTIQFQFSPIIYSIHKNLAFFCQENFIQMISVSREEGTRLTAAVE